MTRSVSGFATSSTIPSMSPLLPRHPAFPSASPLPMNHPATYLPPGNHFATVDMPPLLHSHPATPTPSRNHPANPFSHPDPATPLSLEHHSSTPNMSTLDPRIHPPLPRNHPATPIPPGIDSATPSVEDSPSSFPIDDFESLNAPNTPSNGALNWAEGELRAIQESHRPRLTFTPTRDTVVTRDDQELIIPWQQEPEETIFRRIARDARWNQFLFHGNYFWREILAQHYLAPGLTTDDLDVDNGETVLRGKTKLFEIMKNLKSDTLKRFTQHIAQVVVDYPEIMSISTENEIRQFFVDHVFNINTFNFIWFWMKDYLDLENSSDLAKYFVRNIYGVLCLATFQEYRAREERPNEALYYRDLRHRLYFQCVCHSNFREVSKDQFREMHGRTRHDRPIRPLGNDGLAMFGNMPPPPPPSGSTLSPGSYTAAGYHSPRYT
ncbi:hypothetical protein V8E54_009939 [Elaphomyces granulatus]